MNALGELRQYSAHLGLFSYRIYRDTHC